MLKNYLHQLCDAFSDAISISDKNGIIILVNKKNTELTGIPKEEMVGSSVVEMMRNGVFDVVLNPEIVQTKQAITRVQNISNGRTLVLDGNPVFDKDGNVAFVVTFMRDITALTNLRQKIASQKELLTTFKILQGQNRETPKVSNSLAMRKLYAEVETIADTDATVLLLGETGVGKDVVARAVHANSLRADKVFIKVDCGSIPENLIETELFGYATGTFSGANKNGKVGLIEAAASGSLFLDEIGELPLSTQSRLLRFLQDKEVMRVGSTSSKFIDARIIAATNRDLEKEVAKGRFRSDLYYRLKVAVLTIPPLRKRKDDILPLATYFLNLFCNKYNKKITFSEDAQHLLQHYTWPGNVRELENMIQGLVITGKNPLVEAMDLPITKAFNNKTEADLLNVGSLEIEGRSFKDIMKDLETSVIKAGLKRYGNITELAKNFQVDRSTIFRKVKEIEGQEKKKY
ncbi:sigma-54 interaction domain-containing protein [Desulfovibrio litoralis]|uniref:PAS domain S-box-containing protein n=1 Tax=Desulfovibrio litoralis DSM 11393 TaxID=1121455 RepID=A0A1M7RS14_9BACT|nr:sigma 54-interacting transcriptional regulator [Desulfovibrio litoralis]SHN48960.1 PAS domain S-box-containing protein [Desulfovibrio litoralis DSM 11393]